MNKCIICGMDVHERTIKTCTAAGDGKPEVQTFANTEEGRAALSLSSWMGQETWMQRHGYGLRGVLSWLRVV